MPDQTTKIFFKKIYDFILGLDDINESENPMVKHVNQRVDEIQETVSNAMHNHHMMEFAGMALGGTHIFSVYLMLFSQKKT